MAAEETRGGEPDPPTSVPDRRGGGGLTGWFIRNPVAANLLMALLIIGGLMSALSMRSEAFPTISPGIVSVSVPYPGATPAEVEEAITRRVEEAVLGIDGVKRVTSRASENVGSINVEAADFVDIRRLKDDVEAAVGRLSQFPPENAEKPVVVAPEATGDVVTLVVLGDVSPLELKQAAETIERDLLSWPGVTLVSLSGDRDYEIAIEVSEETLRQYDLTFSEVANAIRASSIDLAAGSITSPSGELLLRTNDRRQSGEAFKSVAIRTLSDGRTLTLGDIAVVNDGFSRSQVSNTYNGKPAIFVQISRASAEDLLKVRAAVDAFAASYVPPTGIELVFLKDQSRLLSERVNLLTRNAIFGFALVFMFLVLTLDLKFALWVSVGIVTAFLGGFLIFGALDVTLTQISLFGLIIVLGLVVDDAVVIGESIDQARQGGAAGVGAVLQGVRSVAAPVIVGVTTTIVAFAPLLLTGGAFAEISRAIPIVVIGVLAVSLLEALLILPSHIGHGEGWSRGVLKLIQDKVARAIRWTATNVVFRLTHLAVRRRYTTLGLALAFFVFCLSLVGNGVVRFIFFPNIEGNELSASVTMPAGTPYSRTSEVVDHLEMSARRLADTVRNETGETLFVSVSKTAGGRASSGGGPGSQSSFATAENIGQVQIELMPFGERKMAAAEIERRWREEVGVVDGVERIGFNSAVGAFGSDIDFELTHSDDQTLLAAASALKQKLADIEGANQIDDSYDLGKDQLVFRLTALGRAAGLKPADIARQMRQAFFGDEVQRIQRGREEVRVYVRYPEEARRTLASLGDFRIRLQDGGSVPLSSVATIEESRAYSSIYRIDGRRVVSVTADIDEAVSTANAANARIVDTVMPQLEKAYPGLRWTQGGAIRAQSEDFASLGQTFLIALLMIYAILATQLRSYSQPFAILAAIPLGFAGAILGHYVLGYDLSFVSMFGMVALAGVAVNASVVLVDRYNALVEAGVERENAAATAAAGRFRAILLTTLTTVLGLAPLLLETSPQAQFLIPMAVSLGFGVLVSAFLVLLVTPAVVLVLGDMARRGRPERELRPADASAG